jgi:hypothetical protein
MIAYIRQNLLASAGYPAALAEPIRLLGSSGDLNRRYAFLVSGGNC